MKKSKSIKYNLATNHFAKFASLESVKVPSPLPESDTHSTCSLQTLDRTKISTYRVRCQAKTNQLFLQVSQCQRNQTTVSKKYLPERSISRVLLASNILNLPSIFSHKTCQFLGSFLHCRITWRRRCCMSLKELINTESMNNGMQITLVRHIVH